MPDETPESSEPQQERQPDRPPVTAVGKLRPNPTAEPRTTWTPEEPAPAREPEREPGTLEQRADRRRREGLRRVQGIPGLQALGWGLLILGGLLYLHGLWATANAVLTGAGDPEQIVAFGGLEILQGTLGLALAAIGLIVAGVFTFLPYRYEPPLVPGTLEFEVAAENLVRSRDLRRILIWVGILVFIVGLALAGYALKQSILADDTYTLSIGGNGYRVHLWGFALIALGIALTLPLAMAQSAVERAATLAEGALTNGRVRRAGEPASGTPEGEDAAPERRLRPPMGEPSEGPEQASTTDEEDARHHPPT